MYINVDVSNKIKNNDLNDILLICREQAGYHLNIDVDYVTIEDVSYYLNQFSNDSLVNVNLI
jgi:hypothetical protein